MTALTLLADDDNPRAIEIRRDERGRIVDLFEDGRRIPLTQYAKDALFIAAYNLDEIEQRRVYWRADIRRTVERLQAGEMEDEESKS